MKPLASKLFIPEVKYLQITCPPPPSSMSFLNNSFVTKNGMVKTYPYLMLSLDHATQKMFSIYAY